MKGAGASGFRNAVGPLTIVLLPWFLGLCLLWLSRVNSRETPSQAMNTRTGTSSHLTYKGVQVDWTFYADWQFKPLFLGKAAYFVFVFHYANNSAHAIYLMPSYTFVAPHERWQAANEEIATYIEDEIEDELGVADEPGLIYRVPAHGTRHYIVAFSKPPGVGSFHVDVDIWQDRTLRIHYRRATEGTANSAWINHDNEWTEKYLGRG